jgi:CDP-6-deoxy-D-xylo-4-hexulose-3-dehydrase
MIPLMKNAFLREGETRRALADFILSAPRLSMDAKCREFEEAFAAFQGSRHAVLFNSGGSANLAMLQALKNLGRLHDGDPVGFSAVTWSTNTMPIIQLGMVPVAVDCDPSTLNVMSRDLLKLIEHTPIKALFITNALGFAGDLGRISEECKRRGIVLLEDNCESFGTELKEGRTGSFGVCASFSFYVAHHMSTIEGGMACTSDPELAEMLRIVRANGWDRNLTPAQQAAIRGKHGIKSEFDARYTFYDLGFNLRPTEITGFIGLQQLKFVAETFRQREANYVRLERAARTNPDFRPIAREHLTLLSNFAFPLVCKDPAARDRYVKRFMDASIEIRPLIAGNMQRQPFYGKYVTRLMPTPGADFLHECALYFGNYPELTDTDLQAIEHCLRP